MNILDKLMSSPTFLSAAQEAEKAAEETRIFGIDGQLLFDAVVLTINVFILFVLLSYLLFNPVRQVLKKRQEKITADRETAIKDKEDALSLKEEYEARLKVADKEAEAILSEARKKALKNEENIINDAKAEAARIIERAKVEAELEKNKAADRIKQEIIEVATLMAGKIVAVSIDEAEQNKLIEETLKEIGDDTWQN